MALNGKELAKIVDATVINPDATVADMENLIEKAKEYHFGVAVGLQCYNQMLIDALQGTGIKVLGAGGLSGVTPLDTKLYMAKACVEQGCGEIESFLNVSYLKSGMYDEIVKETRAIREIAKDQVYKVILETPLLNDEEIATACEVLIDGGVDFVKTGTGTLGATDIHTIEVMAKAVKGRVGMKASGGIRTIETVDAMMELGVTRFGIGLKSALKVLEAADNR